MKTGRTPAIWKGCNFQVYDLAIHSFEWLHEARYNTEALLNMMPGGGVGLQDGHQALRDCCPVGKPHGPQYLAGGKG